MNFELILLRINPSSISALDSKASPLAITLVTKSLSFIPEALILTFRKAPLMLDRRANAPTPAS